MYSLPIFLSSSFITIICFFGVNSTIQKIELIFSRKLVSLDGYSKAIIVINDGFPGPTITAVQGDTVLVNVVNKLNLFESLSVHWHGIDQRGKQWQDGAAYITNCPLPYGSSFVSNLTLSEAGTFWYHAHSGSDEFYNITI